MTPLARLLSLCLLTSSLFLTGCQKSGEETAETQRIVILTNGSSPFWDAASAGAEEGLKEFGLVEKGYKLDFHRADFTVEKQIEKLKEYASSTDVAGVAISVTDPDNAALIKAIQRVRDEGIQVITIDSDVAEKSQKKTRYAYIGTHNVAAGEELGKAIKGLREEGGTVATFVGLKGAANAVERVQGLQAGLGSKFDVATTLEDGGTDRLKADENVRTALDSNKEPDVLVGIWSYNTPAIINVLDDRSAREGKTVAAFDAEPQTIKGMEDGNVDVMVVQNPFEMGRQAVKLLHALDSDDKQAVKEFYPDYGSEGGDRYDTGLRIVVPDDEDAISADDFSDKTEFMTLSEFRKWLSEYGLKGS